MGVITEAARAWASEPFPPYQVTVSRTDIARYARAIGETSPIHYDVGAARAAGHADVVAPPYFPYTVRMQASNLVPKEQLAGDGSAVADVPPLPASRAMAGETAIEFGVPVVAGDTLTMTKRIGDLYEKEGRSGTLVFVVMEFTFANQRDELVMRESFTRIYR